MTGSLADSLERLELWSLSHWSLGTTLVLEFSHAPRAATERGLKRARLVFVRPSRVSMHRLKSENGQIGVRSPRLVDSHGKGIAFEMDGLEGGRVEVEAGEASLYFY